MHVTSIVLEDALLNASRLCCLGLFYSIPFSPNDNCCECLDNLYRTVLIDLYSFPLLSHVLTVLAYLSSLQ